MSEPRTSAEEIPDSTSSKQRSSGDADGRNDPPPSSAATQAGIEDVHEYGDYTLLNSGKLEDELFWFLHTVAKLRIPSTFGFLSEAQDYDETFLQDGGPIRGAEGSKIDGALYIGDADLSSVTYADKLDNFLALGGTNKPDFAGEDSKAPGRQLMWNGRSVPSLGVTIGAQTQERHAAHFCVHFDGAPHMRVLLPATKEALFEWRFGSFLSYHMPIPPRISFLAFPVDRLQDARMKLKEVYRGDVQQYEVPVSGVLLPHFQPNLSRDRMMLRPNTTANSTFDFLRTHIATSGFARDLELRLDFSRHQPLDGDAQLIQSNETLGRLELKDNLIREDQDTLVFFQPFGDRRNRMRHSPFHPLRCDNFVVLFGCARSYVYWIPASRISESWWSDATQVNIPRRDIADCRVPIAGNLDWLEQVYRRIIEPNAGSLRKKDIRIHTQLEHYAVSRSIDDDNGDHDFDVKYYREEIKAARAQLESKPGSPWWDIERANAECAHRGYGIWFPLGHRERIAQAVFVAYEWDETEKSVFDSIGKLPADLHTGDLSPQTPCLLIKMVKTAVAYRKRNGYPSFVSGLKLDKGPLPCLYYIDCSRPVDRASPRSCILVPEEFIDYEYRNQKYADRLVKKERQGAEISSARDVLSLVGVQKGAQIIRDTDLRELITVPFSELMVRQYRDQQDALEAFLAAHEDTVKPLTWSPNLQVSATGDYAVTLARLQQEFGNEWTPTWESAYFINSHGEEDDEEDSE